jgi:hypothetical protein
MSHNYVPLAQYLREKTDGARQLVYEILRRAPECGFTDSPDPKELEKTIEKIERGKK